MTHHFDESTQLTPRRVAAVQEIMRTVQHATAEIWEAVRPLLVRVSESVRAAHDAGTHFYREGRCVICHTEEPRPVNIVDFLLARIAEDEAAALDPEDTPRKATTSTLTGCSFVEFDDPWMLDITPARVPAECQAKRDIVERITGEDDGTAPPQSLVLGDDVLKGLAAVYAGHPDYREEWRP